MGAPPVAYETLHKFKFSDTLFTISLLKGQGAKAWRRELKAENRDKVIVFVQEHYAIFHVAEFSILAGLRIRAMGIPPELGSPADILARYGLSP